jgi:translation elongation factor EF-Tu-like GTPase
VFSITGRGTVALVVVSKLVLLIQVMLLKSLVWELKKLTITGVEMFRKIMIEEKAGITGIFEGVQRRHQRGMVVRSGISKSHTLFEVVEKRRGGCRCSISASYVQVFTYVQRRHGHYYFTEGVEMDIPQEISNYH